MLLLLLAAKVHSNKMTTELVVVVVGKFLSTKFVSAGFFVVVPTALFLVPCSLCHVPCANHKVSA